MAPSLLLTLLASLATQPAPLAAEVAPTATPVAAAPELAESPGHGQRAKRPDPPSLRRRVRKRDTDEPGPFRRPVERPDLSVSRLAELLEGAVYTVQRAGQRDAMADPPGHQRLRRAGGCASHLHLPPPEVLP